MVDFHESANIKIATTFLVKGTHAMIFKTIWFLDRNTVQI